VEISPLIDETKDRTELLHRCKPLTNMSIFNLGTFGKPVSLTKPLLPSKKLPTTTTWHIVIGSYAKQAAPTLTLARNTLRQFDASIWLVAAPRSKTTISGNLQVQGIIASADQVGEITA
jgi:hypothetical protein